MKTRRDFLRIAGWSGLGLFGFPGATVAGSRPPFPIPERAGYGPLGLADENGLQLPKGFSSRVVAVATERPLPSVAFNWHRSPDGGATFAHPDGGWIYVSNCEQGNQQGGASALRFDPAGQLKDVYPILRGTSQNCGGGPTPWGTWISCEETGYGLSYECDPRSPSVVGHPRPALGRFKHEAIAVCPKTGDVYLTEDESNGLLYRFRPKHPGHLDEGTLEAAEILDPDQRGEIRPGEVRPIAWHTVPSPTASLGVPTRFQMWSPTRFNRGEGIACQGTLCCFSTTGDHRVWALQTEDQTLQILYDAAHSTEPSLTQPDNLLMTPNGDVLVAEDSGNLEIVVLDSMGRATPIVRVQGQSGTELTGPALSPLGDRLYFSSQRGPTPAGPYGITYEVRGPF